MSGLDKAGQSVLQKNRRRLVPCPAAVIVSSVMEEFG